MSLIVTVYLGKERMFDKYLYLLPHFENYKTDVPTLENILNYINEL